MSENTLLYWVWLAGALGPGGVHVRDVLDAFGTPQALYEARFSQDLSALLSPGQLHAVQSTQPQSAAGVLARCGQLGVRIAAWDDEAYPEALRLIEDPPPVVYYKGDICLWAGGHCRHCQRPCRSGRGAGVRPGKRP